MKLKKLYSFLTLLTAFLWLGSGTMWGDELTVGTGSNTTDYSPFYGNYVDKNQRNQIVYAVSDLSTMSAMSGKNITSIKFYQSNTNAWSGGFTISMAEISGTGFDSKTWFTDDLTQVFEGTVTGGSTVTITFDNPYYYEGGNLLIDIQTKTTSSNYQKGTFKGNTNVTTKKPAAYAYNSSVSAPYATLWNLPQTTFTYEDAAPVSCPKPTGLAKSAVTATSATFTWTAGGSETSWQYVYLPAVTALTDAAWTGATSGTVSTTPTVTLSNLSAATDYKFYVRADCGSEQSADVNLAFKTKCDPIATYTCGFETTEGITNGSYPTCWEKISSNDYPQVYNYYSKNGSQCLRFYQAGPQYAVLPPFNQDVKNLEISFWYRNGSYSETIEVGYMTDPEDASTFVSLTTGGSALAYISDYGSAITEINLSGAAVGAKYIAFKYTASSSWSSSYIDDITVSVASSCAKPTGLTAAAASATSINLSWTKGGDESKWNAQYRIGSGAWTAVNNIPTTIDGTNCTATLTGLTAQTTYEIQVQADCSGSTSSWSNSATETTECNKKSIPWTCGFEESEGYATGSYSSEAPNKCWNILNINGTAPYGYVNNSSSYVRTGSKSLYFVSATDRDGYLIFPELDAALNTLQIEFYHKEEGATQSSTLTLGYMTDVTDASSFVPLKEDPFTRVAGTWSHEEESLAGVPANVASTARLAFKVGKTSNSSWYLGIDDITISELPSCPKPTLTATNVIYNGATITWSEGSSTNKWKLQYSTDGENWTDANSGNLIAAASFNLTGLTSGTTYQVQAQAECAGAWSNAVSFTPQCLKPSKPEVPQATITTTSAVVNWTAGNGEDEWYLQYKKSSESVWSDAIHVTTNPTYTLTGLQSGTTYGVHVTAGCKEDYTASTEFDTECAVVTSFPWTENFESQTASTIAKCWDISASGTSTKSGTSYYVWGVYEYSSNKMLRMYNYMVDNGTAIIYSPSITIPNNDKEYELSFDYTNTANCGAFKVKVSKDAGANFAEVGSYENATSVNEITNPGTFTPAKISLADYAGETIILQFYALANYSEGAIFVDNIKIDEAPSCANPTDLEVDEASIGTETATATWTAGGTETAWMLQYKTAAVEWTDPSVVEETVNTTPSYDFTGLTENTAYTVRVKADCGSGNESEWFELAQPFRTDCTPKTITWNEGFESATVDALPSCWEVPTADNSYDYAKVVASNAKTGDKCLTVHTYGVGSKIVELPVFASEIKNLQITFDYKNSNTNSNYGQLEVGYYSESAFTRVGDALARTDAYGESATTVEMPNNAPDGARIAFRAVGVKSNYHTYGYIDNIVVALKPTCYTPTNVQAVATSDGAVVTWNDDEASEWSLQLQQGELGWNTPITGITSKTYTLTGLTVDLPYQVQVKAVCGVGDESAWSASADFTPKCNAPTSLAVTARAQNSATFSWTSSETAWVLQYSTDGENWESENVATNPFTLTGLAAGQTYQAKIQSACGSAFTDAVEFSTWCGLQDAADLPLNATSFTALPECWEATFKGEWSGISGNKICFYGTEEQWIVLPAYDIDLNKLSATFTFSTSNASLEFGYIDEPNGAFTAFASQPTSGVELDLAAEAAAPKYIAVRYYDGGSNLANATISSVYVRKTPNCLAPTGVAGTPGVGSASISWTESGSAEAWNLQYKTGSADWTTVAVTENPYNLTGLEQGVSYKVRVQANCGGEDGVSDWSDEASFTTNCEGIAALPWYADFSVALSNCWTVHYQSTSYIPSANAFSQSLTISGGKKDVSNNVVVLPAISASLTNAVMSFEYRGSTGASYAQLEVGYMTDKADTTTFVRLGEALAQASSYAEARVALNTVPANAYLAFRYAGGSSNGDQYIKDLRVINAYTLADADDNTATLAGLIGKTVDLTINRTLYCDGDYNTICLPFDLPTLDGTPLAGGELWAFRYGYVENGELLMRIAPASSIAAGVPYLITFASGDNIVNPIFTNVTITKSAGVEVGQTDDAKFVGILKPEAFSATGDDVHKKLFVLAGDQLAWADVANNLKSFRAYFRTAENVSGTPVSNHMPARIVRGEQVATGIDDVHGDVQSLKILENGRVVIIRNGVKYSVQGQVISK